MEQKGWFGVESIIPSIYKSYKENYKIIFNINELNGIGLYRKINESGIAEPVYEIDLEEEVLGSDSEKEEFIIAILYGKNKISSEAQKRFVDRNIVLNSDGIYDIILNKEFVENLGVYYQEEVGGVDVSTPDSDKTLKRVITYENYP